MLLTKSDLHEEILQRPGERSYAVTKLGDVSIMNLSRFISRPAAVGWNVVIGHLLVVQHWPNAPSIVRLQAADILDRIVTAASKELPDATDDRHRQNQEQLLEALKHQVEPQANRIPTSIDVEIRQAGLETLYRFVESQGHAISCGWATIFAILQTACSTRAESRLVDATVVVSAATTAKTAQLVRVAFPALQLICSDFLSALTVQEISLCIDTLTAFGRQTDDVNVALTVSTNISQGDRPCGLTISPFQAGNLLWQVSDHLQAGRRQKEDAHLYLDLWMDLLHSLLELCRDTRQEVRDGAIQILWRSIELYGASLDPASWEKCLSGVVFPLLAALNDGLASTETTFMSDEVEKTAMGIPLTHKQWDDSKILAINSAGTVFFNELPGEIATLDNFQQICKNFINYLQSSFLHDRPAVATAAAKALEKIASIQWDIAKDCQAAFVASELWNSWLEVGKILEEGSKQGLTQQNLEGFTNIMATLQARKHIDTTDNRILSLLGVLKTILTYPYSSDYRPDQDVMPPVQTTVVKVLDSIDLSSITVASAVLQDLAEYMTLAYTTLSEAVRSPTLNDEPRLNQKVTYIALSKASTGRILDIFERFKDHAAVYESAIEAVLAVRCLLCLAPAPSFLT